MNLSAEQQQEIIKTLDCQRDFFASYQTRATEFRISHLQKLKTAIQKHEHEIMISLWRDLHKSEFESYITEIGMVISEIGHQIKLCKKHAAPTTVNPSLFVINAKSQVYYEPYGLTLIVSPWNYPFHLCFMPLIGAIATGNCVTLKLSPDAPNTNTIIKAIVAETFGVEYVSIFEGHREVNEFLFSQPFDHIFLTGSPQLGKIAMRHAAEHLTKVTLELGGKSPCIVDSDAKISLAVKRIVFGKLINSGQTCIAPDYIMIHSSVRNAFIEEFKHQVEVFFGPHMEEASEYPRIISEGAMQRLIRLLSCGDIVYGGSYNIKTRFFHPTLMEHVPIDSELMQNEIFGPIFPIITFENIDEVIHFVNSHPKPLALYYFTEDAAKAHDLLCKTSSGGACINDTIMHIVNKNLPFGGVQNSGIGNYHGEFSYETFSHRKAVLKTSSIIDFAIKYPPFGKKLKWIRKLF